MLNAFMMLRLAAENISGALSLIVSELNDTAPNIERLAEVLEQVHAWDPEIEILSEKIKLT